MNNLDYSLLRGRIILFSCVLIACALLLWFSFSQLSKQEQMMGATQSEMDHVEEEISNLNNLLSLFENFNSDYKKYERKGFLNEENRLTWIETLEQTANQLGLKDLRYEISPRQKLDNENTTLPPSITLYQSKLTLESGLVHEGDLINLVSNLNQLNSGLFVVDSCQIQRMGSTAQLASSSNFHATCDTLWYTAEYDEKAGIFIEDEL